MSASEAERSLRLVAKSFSAVGHELAGPLQTAVNALFVLERKQALLPPEVTPSLRALEQAVETLRARLDRLLRLPQAFHATREETSVTDVVERALLFLGDRAARVVVDVAGGTSVAIDCRAAAEAVGELLLNALEAASPGAMVSLAAAREGEAFVARVSNTGAAFPSDPADAMDPFFSPGAKTLGLGLPVARAVALSHGGELRLAHQAGTSVATLTLPGVAP